MKLASTWIHSCHEQLVLCKDSSSLSVLQTRILYVLPGLVKLVDSATLPSGKILYIALSYCWGKETEVNFERDSMSDFRRRIDQSKLYRIHQDAIEACRRLHIRYIWYVNPGIRILQLFDSFHVNETWKKRDANVVLIGQDQCTLYYTRWSLARLGDWSQDYIWNLRQRLLHP